ncbi:MAG: DUF4831 family protein [Bacteroidales bacterium]|nr:DUF4831 family protein [Bacteroidales bacterium]
MKKIVLTSIALVSSLFVANAQKADPEATVVYSLPSTTLTLEVEAVKENFFAGPYAKYAQKYLGINARQDDETVYTLSSVRILPKVEADLNARYTILAGGKNVDASLMKLTRQGLISMNGVNHSADEWRFAPETKGDFTAKGVGSNLMDEEMTLYKNGKVAVQQSAVVEKTPEKKAEEAAQMIFKLRTTRVQILTGDTDANYSGQAMGTAIEEISRLEKEYISLFTGYSEYQTQKVKFEVIPDPSKPIQKYIAFRISETQGLVPGDNISGRPILLQIDAEEIQEVTEADRKAKGPFVYYRIPAICQIKLLDGSDVVLQTRTPVYQLGVTGSYPLLLMTK